MREPPVGMCVSDKHLGLITQCSALLLLLLLLLLLQAGTKNTMREIGSLKGYMTHP